MDIQKTYNEEGRLVSLKLYLDCFVNGVQRNDLGRALWPKFQVGAFKAIPTDSSTEVIGRREQDFVVVYDEDISWIKLQSIQFCWTDQLTKLADFEEKLKIIEEARDL